jgi:tetratricopeptide (TPR) repeat protein
MPTQIKHQLFRLIKSLTKSEKRNFKLFATRAGATPDSKFIRLFDAIDKSKQPDDEPLINRIGITAGKLSNLKRHLYQQVLTSLRLIYINKEIDIELREQIDFTRILYGKGHYLDALRLLERAKDIAVKHNQDILHLEILELQKLIEARHVTLSRQVDNKMDLLLKESSERNESVMNTSRIFSLNIQLHGLYIEHGHSRTQQERTENEAFWNKAQREITGRGPSDYTFNQKVNLFQANMWFHYLQLDFTAALEVALEAATCFTLEKLMTVKDPDLYLRCLYYVTMFGFLNNQVNTVQRYLTLIDKFLDNNNTLLNRNTRYLGDVYRNLSRFNLFFMNGEFDNAYSFGQALLAEHKAGGFAPNSHRWALFLYKCAGACFLTKRYDEALDYLNDIINMRSGIFREDLLINTRILHAICNFELANYSLVDYHLKSVNRLLNRSRETAKVHTLAASTLRRLLRAPIAEHNEVFEKLKTDLTIYNDHPFEQKAMLYLDLAYWLNSHLAPIKG